MWKMTLREWQKTVKPREEIIFNASEYVNRNDGWVDFTIGVSVEYGKHPLTLEQTQLGEHEYQILCAISLDTDIRRRPNSPNRHSFFQTLSQKGVQNIKMDSALYFELLPHIKFVISPEGNGIDCHRHYEALFAGCIPIVEDHPGIREKYAGCPVLYTKDYSEITNEYLDSVWNDYMDITWDFSKLMLSSYSPEVVSQIKDNGNFWAQGCCGKRWY